ncbi:MAG: fructose-1,6-bisphosphatase [Rikenellaceae bacterium]
MTKNDIHIESRLDYLKLLATKFPTISVAATEIINLQAILNLPKGTEHFVTDLHGEYDAFQHVLRNASGVIKSKVEFIFEDTLKKKDKENLCTLIYYPEEKLDSVIAEEADIDDWYRITLNQLIDVCRMVSSKYTRSKVRKALPADFSYIIEELLHESQNMPNKQDYFNGIISTIISIDRAYDFIVALCNLIQRLTIDTLHIVGDIYDRGPGAHKIMDRLLSYHSYDIQWGNHDILWMGAACGNEACIANVVRICTRYANFESLEDGYGINMLPLARFAMDVYKDDPCELFIPKVDVDDIFRENDIRLISQMHKAIAIIQFKVEHDIISRHSEYMMDERDMLHRIDYNNGTITIGGVTYELLDKNFPTIDPADPYRLTDGEMDVLTRLKISFANSDKLHTHIRCLYSKGSLYLRRNNNLLFHASIPMTADGEFKEVCIGGNCYKGKALLDKLDRVGRAAYFKCKSKQEKEDSSDYMWYMWCGPDSPLFDKSKMATFERYFIADKETHKEKKGEYYTIIDTGDLCGKVLEEFGLDPVSSHIINGHVPVKCKKGERPIKAGGRRLVIDGGFSKAYRGETGIAGYTLIYNSFGLQMVQHEPFESTEKAIEEGRDIISIKFVVEEVKRRLTVRDTDIGQELVKQVDDLKQLLLAYRMGLIK